MPMLQQRAHYKVQQDGFFSGPGLESVPYYYWDKICAQYTHSSSCWWLNSLKKWCGKANNSSIPCYFSMQTRVSWLNVLSSRFNASVTVYWAYDAIADVFNFPQLTAFSELQLKLMQTESTSLLLVWLQWSIVHSFCVSYFKTTSFNGSLHTINS